MHKAECEGDFCPQTTVIKRGLCTGSRTSTATLNALPIAPAPLCPPLQLFGWGVNDEGQLGMGPVANLGDPYIKPKRNTWVEQKIEEDEFGEDGGGLETVAAGGMHTLFIDENGTVRSLVLSILFLLSLLPGMVMWRERRRVLG